MKILHVMSTVARGSGVAQVIMRYFREVHNIFTFDFLCYSDLEESFKDEIYSLGGNIYFLGRPTLATAKNYLKELNSFFSKHGNEYDAMHLHELYMGIVYFTFAKKYGIEKRIAHSHTTMLSEHRIRAFRNKLLFIPTKILATDYFACSIDAGKAAFGNAVINHDSFYLLSNAIRFEEYSFNSEYRKEIRSELGWANSDIVGHIGRFSSQKNHKFLLKVFNVLLKINPDSKLILIGEGPLEREIRMQVEEYKISDKVIFTGQQKDISKYLAAMDVFFLPSVSEGLGMVLIEAQANGLPCIVSDVVPNEARLLDTYKNLSLNDSCLDWAQAIQHLFGERRNVSSSDIKKMGYDIESESQKLVDHYNSICSR